MPKEDDFRSVPFDVWTSKILSSDFVRHGVMRCFQSLGYYPLMWCILSVFVAQTLLVCCVLCVWLWPMITSWQYLYGNHPFLFSLFFR